MKIRASNIWIAVPCVLIVLSALVGGFLPAALEGGVRATSGFEQLQDKLFFFGVCALTAIIEEALFRGALMRAAVHFGSTWQRAAFISAVVFGLLHLGLPAGELSGSPVAWAQCVLKVLQGCAFGYTLAVLYAHLRKLWACMLLHFTFDALYFAVYFSNYTAFPTTYTTGANADLAGLTCSFALLAASAVIAWVSWKRV